jgi:uncharacterized protein YggE
MASFRMSAEPGRLGWLTTGAAVGVLAAVVLAPSFGPAATRAATDNSPVEHTISVSGVGRILIKPDVADLSLGISVVRQKARDSEAAAAEIMTKVIAALKAAGIKDADIQTSSLSLQPEYDWSSNTQRLTGYRTDNIVMVTMRDLSTVGETLDAAVDAGATTVNGLSFRVDDKGAVEAQARDAAMKDAKSKADALAKAAGVNITGVASISEVSSPIPGPIMYERMAAGVAKDSVTPIEPGNVTLEVSVTVTYLIG